MTFILIIIGIRLLVHIFDVIREDARDNTSSMPEPDDERNIVHPSEFRIR